MPKEHLHLHIAHDALRSLSDGPLAQLIHRHQEAYLLGSVAHDSLFNYEVFYPKDKLVKSNRVFAHTRPNTLEFLSDYKQQETMTEEGWAFLCGAVSHVCADTTFHPLVYYYSGYNSKDGKAMGRHLRIETLFDMTINKIYGSMPSLRSLLRKVSVPQLESAFAVLHFGQEESPPFLAAKALRSHGIIQRLYSSHAVASLAKIFAPQYKNMFYVHTPSALRHQNGAFEVWEQQPQYFLNPVSGENMQGSFADLFHQASYLTTKTLEQINHTYNHQPIRLTGANLDTGLIKISSAQMRYFGLTSPQDLFKI